MNWYDHLRSQVCDADYNLGFKDDAVSWLFVDRPNDQHDPKRQYGSFGKVHDSSNSSWYFTRLDRFRNVSRYFVLRRFSSWYLIDVALSQSNRGKQNLVNQRACSSISLKIHLSHLRFLSGTIKRLQEWILMNSPMNSTKSKSIYWTLNSFFSQSNCLKYTQLSIERFFIISHLQKN